MDEAIDVTPKNTSENNGGGGAVCGEIGTEIGGPNHLKRSELALLRRAEREYPISDEDRAVCVGKIMELVHTAKKPRLLISAVKTVIAMDTNNVKRQTNRVIADKPPDLPRQLTVNYNALSLGELLVLRDLMVKAGVVEFDEDGAEEPADDHASATIPATVQAPDAHV
jgi:hypothetical protein